MNNTSPVDNGESLNDILRSYYLAHINNSRYKFEVNNDTCSTNSNNQLYIAQPGKAIHVITEEELTRIAGVNPIYCAYYDPDKLFTLWPQLKVLNASGIWYIGDEEFSNGIDLIGCVVRYCKGEPMGTSSLPQMDSIRLRDLLTEYGLDSLIPELDRSCRATSYYCNIL
ncbi:hypothetical protein E24_00073 [Faustovirus]|nr:hypothetical protein PRJ_Fausto_00065 [Faustovirus]AMN83006.1 hypothetical protein E24_00073 [Faustovirus]AMN83992.1 hypothetical protein D5a_00073 [Faustovirus]AMN84976.1 hypothetical protein E23_00073 [Faustovirus]QBR98978.1 hypothetical protein [Faustovirus mariensis]